MAKHPTEIIAEEDRCRRSDGRNWRCAFRRFGESIYCLKHFQYYQKNKPKVRVSGNPRNNQARVRVKMEPPSMDNLIATSGKKRGRPAAKKAAQNVPVVKRERTEDGGEGVSDVRVSEATARKKKVSQLLKNPEIPRRKRRERNPASVRVKREPQSMDERKAISGKKRGRSLKKEAAEEVPLVKRERTEDGGEGVSGARVSQTTAMKKRGRPAKNNAAQEVPLVKREREEDGREGVSGVKVSETMAKKRGKSFKKNPAQEKRTESGRGYGAYWARVSKTTYKKKGGWGTKGKAAQGVPVMKKERTEIGGEEGVSGMEKNGEHNGTGDGEEVIRVMELSQIWAFPHESDGFPRFYARIERFIPTLSLVQVTPLIPHPMTKHELKFSNQDFSLGCGMFRASDFMTVKDVSSATHRAMASSVGDGSFFYNIFPKKGEVWATYTWDDLTNDVEFKLVEVLSDFSEVDGVDVAALAQIERSENCGVYKWQVHEGFYMVRTFSSDYMPMFSHQVLASRIVKYGKKFWEVVFH